MKKLILSIVAFAAASFSSFAQTEQGKFIVGGTASYQSTKSDADNAEPAENFSLVPNFGYFVSDNFALGTGLGYTYSKANFSSPSGQNEAIVVRPFGRYYMGLADQFKFFGQLSIPMAFGTTKSTDANGDVITKTGTSTTVGVAVSPGFAFFPTRKVGIEFALNGISYERFKVKDADENDVEGAGREDFSFGTNLFAPQIGIQFHF